jgi:flavodoxin
MKTLIVYYSLEGNTDFIAKKLASEMDADLERLKPKNDIEGKSFKKFFWGGKQVLFGEMPELESFELNLEEYDLIIFGTPVWAGSFTPAFKTLFSKYSFENKRVAVFCCHDGGKGKIFEKFKTELKDSNIIAETEFVKTSKNRETRQKEAGKWAKYLSLIKDQE